MAANSVQRYSITNGYFASNLLVGAGIVSGACCANDERQIKEISKQPVAQLAYVCGALRQDIIWRPPPFPSPFFPSLPSPPNSSTSIPSLPPSLPSLPLEVGPLKSS